MFVTSKRCGRGVLPPFEYVSDTSLETLLAIEHYFHPGAVKKKSHKMTRHQSISLALSRANSPIEIRSDRRYMIRSDSIVLLHNYLCILLHTRAI